METACSVEEDGHEVSAGVGYKAEDKSAGITL